MQFEQIIYEVKNTTAIVTLNRPEKRNALSAQILRELSDRKSTRLNSSHSS